MSLVLFFFFVFLHNQDVSNFIRILSGTIYFSLSETYATQVLYLVSDILFYIIIMDFVFIFFKVNS